MHSFHQNDVAAGAASNDIISNNPAWLSVIFNLTYYYSSLAESSCHAVYLKPAPNDDYGARIEATTAKPTPQPLSHVCWERATTLLVSIWYMISRDVGHRSYEEVNLLFWMSFEISQKDVEGDAPDSNYVSYIDGIRSAW